MSTAAYDPGLLREQETPLEIGKFIIRQPPMREKDDYDSENSWISDVQWKSTAK